MGNWPRKRPLLVPALCRGAGKGDRDHSEHALEIVFLANIQAAFYPSSTTSPPILNPYLALSNHTARLNVL
jgi:hypothetical protein